MLEIRVESTPSGISDYNKHYIYVANKDIGASILLKGPFYVQTAQDWVTLKHDTDCYSRVFGDISVVYDFQLADCYKT